MVDDEAFAGATRENLLLEGRIPSNRGPLHRGEPRMTTGAPPLAATRLKRKGRRVLGRYELIGELARGGMGTVYLARHAGEAGFQRLFAVKVLHAHLAAETAFVDMLRDEARIAARIHHPNVVAIVDLGVVEDLHYVVMEYVEGPAFAKLLKPGTNPSTVALVAAVVTDALEGLHAAHTLKNDDGEELHLVHRDVSPQNILVGVDGVGRITDFGIAKAEARITSTQPGVRKGKLAFMSPEQIKDGDNVDVRADIWATGVVLWTALTGKPLFKAENDAATVHNVLSKEVPPPSKQGQEPTPIFDDVVMRALERDPEKRFATALEMAEAIRRAAYASGLVGSRYQVAKWVTETFGEELALRRKAIKEAAQQREDTTDSSLITALPTLPTMTSGPQSSLGGVTNTPSGASSSAGSGALSGSISEQSSLSSIQSFAEQGEQDKNPFASPKSRLWIPIAAVGALLLGVVAFAIRAASEADKTAAGSPGIPAVVAPPPKPEPVTEKPTEAPEPTAPATAAPAPSDTSAEPADEKPVRSRRIPFRGGVAKVGPPAPASAKDPKPPAEGAADKTPAGPVPAPNPEFEKNPYLRR